MFLLFIAPNMALFAVFSYWPMLRSIQLSFTDWSLMPGEARYVGFENYYRILADERSWRVVLNTLAYALCVVMVAQTLAFLLALLLNREVMGRTFFRAAAFLPHVTTTAAAALAWVLLLDPRHGPLAVVYNAAGVDGPYWLRSGGLALIALMIVGIWKEIGFSTVFFLAGLQDIPAECIESARLDGASRLAVLRHVTLPLLSPVAFLLSVSGFIAAIKAFDVVAVMTEGGPVYPDTATFVYHLYRLAFRDYEAGYASAFAVLFFVAVLVMTAAQFRMARRWVHYGD